MPVYAGKNMRYAHFADVFWGDTVCIETEYIIQISTGIKLLYTSARLATML